VSLGKNVLLEVEKMSFAVIPNEPRKFLPVGSLHCNDLGFLEFTVVFLERLE
jgi:hypothetical protein